MGCHRTLNPKPSTLNPKLRACVTTRFVAEKEQFLKPESLPAQPRIELLDSHPETHNLIPQGFRV